jgi:hypothetical protein
MLCPLTALAFVAIVVSGDRHVILFTALETVGAGIDWGVAYSSHLKMCTNAASLVKQKHAER